MAPRTTRRQRNMANRGLFKIPQSPLSKEVSLDKMMPIDEQIVRDRKAFYDTHIAKARTAEERQAWEIAKATAISKDVDDEISSDMQRGFQGFLMGYMKDGDKTPMWGKRNLNLINIKGVREYLLPLNEARDEFERKVAKLRKFGPGGLGEVNLWSLWLYYKYVVRNTALTESNWLADFKKFKSFDNDGVLPTLQDPRNEEQRQRDELRQDQGGDWSEEHAVHSKPVSEGYYGHQYSGIGDEYAGPDHHYMKQPRDDRGRFMRSHQGDEEERIGDFESPGGDDDDDDGSPGDGPRGGGPPPGDGGDDDAPGTDESRPPDDKRPADDKPGDKPVPQPKSAFKGKEKILLDAIGELAERMSDTDWERLRNTIVTILGTEAGRRVIRALERRRRGRSRSAQPERPVQPEQEPAQPTAQEDPAPVAGTTAEPPDLPANLDDQGLVEAKEARDAFVARIRAAGSPDDIARARSTYETAVARIQTRSRERRRLASSIGFATAPRQTQNLEQALEDKEPGQQQSVMRRFIGRMIRNMDPEGNAWQNARRDIATARPVQAAAQYLAAYVTQQVANQVIEAAPGLIAQATEMLTARTADLATAANVHPDVAADFLVNNDDFANIALTGDAETWTTTRYAIITALTMWIQAAPHLARAAVRATGKTV